MPYGLKDIELQKLRKVFESNERIECVVLYGSRAKGNYKPFSDVDITLIGEELTHTDLNHLSLAIDDLLLPYQFDISIFHTLKNEALIDHIHRVGITIYERESEWKEYKLGELGTVITGKTPSSRNPEDWGEEMLFITPSDYRNFGKHASNSERKLSSVGIERLKNKVLPPKSILVTCIGSDMGKVVMNDVHCITNQQINAIIPHINVDNDFMYYLLVSIYDTLRIYGGDGTAVPIVNKKDFENIKVELPISIDDQRRIASILTSLDDKIDLLRRENATLEAMAETLFRQWFVVEAKEEWEEVEFSEAIDVYDSRRKPLSKMEREKMKNGNTLYPYYGAAEIMDYIDSYLFDGEYILMGEDGTVKTDDGYPILQYATGKFWPNNHAHVLQAKPPYNNCFVWNYLKTTNIESIVTGAVQPKINQANLLSLPFYKYPTDLVNKYLLITRDWWTKKLNNNKQIQTLNQTRDGLLPKLMSNEIQL